MAKAAKWIVVSNPQQRITRVARRAVRQRLQGVWRLAPLAAWRPEEIEHAHQLRVATRRARAALQLFEDLLPRKRTRRIGKSLRELRQAAGEARDLDVLGQRLGKVAQEAPQSSLQPMVEQLQIRRRQAQEPLIQAFHKIRRAKFKSRSRALVKRLRWPHATPEPAFADAVRARLTPLVEQFFQAAREDLSNPKALHRMRVCGKQLRYSMELLAGAFDEFFREELYPIFEAVQEKLGAINDHVVGIQLLSAWLERGDGPSQEIADLIVEEQQQYDAARNEFLAWWNAARAADLRRRFDELLSDAAHSRAEQPIPVFDRAAVGD